MADLIEEEGEQRLLNWKWRTQSEMENSIDLMSVGVKNGYDGITTRKSSEIVFPKEIVKRKM